MLKHNYNWNNYKMTFDIYVILDQIQCDGRYIMANGANYEHLLDRFSGYLLYKINFYQNLSCKKLTLTA
jgi:hypothetical protein